MRTESRDRIKVRFKTHDEGIKAGGILLGVPNPEGFEFVGEIYRLSASQLEILKENGFEFEFVDESV